MVSRLCFLASLLALVLNGAAANAKFSSPLFEGEGGDGISISITILDSNNNSGNVGSSGAFLFFICEKSLLAKFAHVSLQVLRFFALSRYGV
jgi:hypothetical protein